MIAFFVLLGLAIAGALAIRHSMNSHGRPPGQGDISFAVSPRDEVVFNAVGDGGRDSFHARIPVQRGIR